MERRNRELALPIMTRPCQEKRRRPVAGFALRLFYDGQCPFCRSEMDFLRRRDRRGRLVLEDVSRPGFDPSVYGLTLEQVNGVLHAIQADGRIVTRMEAVRAAYQAVGLGWVVAFTRWPVLRPIFDRAYGVFARNRHPWGRILRRAARKPAASHPTDSRS